MKRFGDGEDMSNLYDLMRTKLKLEKIQIHEKNSQVLCTLHLKITETI